MQDGCLRRAETHCLSAVALASGGWFAAGIFGVLREMMGAAEPGVVELEGSLTPEVVRQASLITVSQFKYPGYRN